MSCYYDNLLNHVINYYRDLYVSLYNFNNEILNEHLLKELFNRNHVLLKHDMYDDVEILSANIDTWDKYGNGIGGQWNYLDTRTQTTPRRNRFNATNSVIVYSNANKTSMLNMCYDDITEITSIIMVKQNMLRLSNVKGAIKSDPETAQTMKTILQGITSVKNSYLVFDNVDKLNDELQKLDLEVIFDVLQHNTEILTYHNRILENMGAHFIPFEKKERLVTDEVNIGKDLVQKRRDKFIQRITTYLNRFNMLFNTDLQIIEDEVKEDEM